MIDARLSINLHANQMSLHTSGAKHKVVKAGKRFGKTKWALFELCQEAGRRPNEVFWHICPSYTQAKKIAWWDLGWLLPPQYVKRSVEQDLVKELYNGAKIQLIGADNEDALRGPQLGGVVFDEAAYIKDYVWYAIISGQLLGTKKAFAYFISSPNKTGRNWFSNFWDEAKAKQRAGDTEWAAFYYTIFDNPTLPRDEIEKLKASMSDEIWNLEYMAIESDFSGQKYCEFTPEKHVTEFVPDQKEIYIGIDWGLDHPTAMLFSYVKDGKVWIYDEFCRSGLLIKEICHIFKEKCSSKEIQWTVIDPSANRRDQVTGKSVKDEFSRNGIGCVDGDRRGADVRGGRGTDIVKMFFKNNKIVIHPRCKNLIAELRNLQWGDKTGDDVTDCLRYLLVRFHDTNNAFSAGNLFPRNEEKSNPREMRIDNLVIAGSQNKNDMSWAWNGEDAA